MTYTEIQVELRGAVMWMYLNRPDQMNSLTTCMVGELTHALDAAARDTDVGVVVLSGKGRAFCAGADLKEVPSQEAVRGSRRTFFDVSDDFAGLLSDFPKPMLAAVNGFCCAGGLEIALAADVMFASDKARIGDVHSNFGLLPGLGGSVRLVRAVGPQRARFLMFSGDMITAAEAADWGLVARTFDGAVLESEVQAFAERLTGKSRAGLLRMRQLADDGFDLPIERAMRNERVVYREYYQRPELAEGQDAFRNKRTPDFRQFWTQD